MKKCMLLIAFLTFAYVSCYAQKDDLFTKVSQLDSVFFTAYNNCDTITQRMMYADNIEFYHDQGGLITSKEALMDGTKRNICGKVTRELVKGSLEVSPIPGYGAVELGSHMFRNKLEPDAIPHPSKFVIIWHEQNGHWTISRVISLH